MQNRRWCQNGVAPFMRVAHEVLELVPGSMPVRAARSSWATPLALRWPITMKNSEADAGTRAEARVENAESRRLLNTRRKLLA